MQVRLNALREALLSPAEAAALDAHGHTDAAVLVPLYGPAGDPDIATGIVFTKRRADLRKHAGEISFPGGRQDEPDEDLRLTALREAEEEIGLDPTSVELIGALPPTPTIVTNYRIHPFVGVIPHEPPLHPSPEEVEAILMFEIGDLIAGYERRRLVRRGVPFRSDTYLVGDELIWGATGRILHSLFERLEQASG